jgi:predicted phosphodiesterase
MRVLLLSDIHANIHALEAVLDDSPPGTYDQLLVLGDLVGYGASPNEVVDRIFGLTPDAVVRGNHDRVAAGIEDPHHFNQVAAEAARWTLSTLTEPNRARVEALPEGPLRISAEIEVCHGTPYDEDAYVFDMDDAHRALTRATSRICFFGHTHIPVAFSLAPAASQLDTVAPEPGAQSPTVVALAEDSRHLVNPGSIGQPRDGDPRAAYALYDTQERHIELRRVPYRVDLAQAQIVAAGLPEALARRLGVGR